MSIEVEDDDEVFVRKKRVMPSTDVDITPMIDLTFQLLIFFMVTSTMQGNPPAVLPASVSAHRLRRRKSSMLSCDLRRFLVKPRRSKSTKNL